MKSKVLKREESIEKNSFKTEIIEHKDNVNQIFFAKFNKSCLITYIGILFGILAMYFAFIKEWYIRYSLSCLILAGICDMYDGKFARACKRTEEEKEFGVQLDSLADTLCFIATPIVIMLSIGMTSWYHFMSYILLAICGVSRLGYFNIKADLDKAVKTYSGLPVTSTAITYPLIGILHMIISTEALSVIYFILTLVTATLFVINVKIPKLKGKAYILVPIFAIAGIILLLVR